MRTLIAMMIAVSAMLIFATSVAWAGAISITQFTSDATSGISNSKTYTHAVDFGATGDSPTINGVTFTKVNSCYPGAYNYSTKVYTIDTSSTLGFIAIDYATGGNTSYGWKCAGGGSAIITDTTQGVYGLMYDMMFVGGASVTGDYSLELTGLTTGQAYDFRLYYRQWDTSTTRSCNIDFDETNDAIVDATTTVTQGANSAAYYLSYKFTPTSNSLKIRFYGYASGYSWPWYGFSNEVVPEPSTLALLASGLIGLLAYAWRKRK